MDWTSGYVAEIDYTHGYYRELAPGLIDFALLLSGHEPPDRSSMRYLELGYGQGLSANIHAAAVAGEVWGADFNPAHAANAQSLAHHAQSPGPLLRRQLRRSVGGTTCRLSTTSSCTGCGAGSPTTTAGRSSRSSAAG